MPPNDPASSRSSAFGADVLTLVTGTTIAQVITICASPIITRLYGPETFGLLALFTSITSIIGVIACMRYELAIMLPKSDVEAANVFGLSIIFVIIVSIATIPFLIILQQPILLVLNAPQLSPFLWFIPPMIFASGIFLALNYWNSRTKHFHRLSIARVMRSGASTGTQLGMGFLGLASGGALIGASILGQIVSTFVLGIQIMRDHLSFFKQNITWKGMINVLKRYSNFPKYDIWSALLNTISWQIPIFLLSYFFSTTIVGYYSLGMMMIQMPMSFIGGAIAQVFYQRASMVKNDGQLGPLVENIFTILVKLGIFPMIVLLLIGKDLFAVVFGPQWAISGTYVQILSVWAFVWFISSPLSTVASVLEKLSWGLYLNIFIFSTRVISLVIGGLLGNVLIALLLFSISGFIVYGYLCVKIMQYSHVPFKNIQKIVYTNFIQIIPAGIVLLVLELLNVNSITIIIITGLIGAFYYWHIIKSDPALQTIFSKIFPKLIRKL